MAYGGPARRLVFEYVGHPTEIVRCIPWLVLRPGVDNEIYSEGPIREQANVGSACNATRAAVSNARTRDACGCPLPSMERASLFAGG